MAIWWSFPLHPEMQAALKEWPYLYVYYITPHQKLGALMFTARHSVVQIIPILVKAISLSSPFFAGTVRRPYRILTKQTKEHERN